jgi:hypothetical protein
MNKILQIIAIASATVFASCEKYETPAPAPADYHDNQGDDTPDGSNDSLKYNLDWSSQLLGTTLKDVKPTGVSPLVDFVDGQNKAYGEFISFDIPEKDILIQFRYEYGKGITGGGGRVDGKSFILNVGSSTINICNSHQNVSVVYDLFSSENDVDS